MQQMLDLKEINENLPSADLLRGSGLNSNLSFEPTIALQTGFSRSDFRIVPEQDGSLPESIEAELAESDFPVKPQALDTSDTIGLNSLPPTTAELNFTSDQQQDLFSTQSGPEQGPIEVINSDVNQQPQDALPADQSSQNTDGEIGTIELTADQKIEEQTIIGQLAAIENDIEDDIYNRDGGTNDSEMAGSRLAAMSGRLSGYFANMASGLVSMRMVALAKKDADNTKQIQLDIQDEQEKEKEEKAKKDQEDFEEGMSQGNNNYQSQTISQSTLDNMQWEGDQNDIWEFMGQSGSRQSWYEAAKSSRQKLNKTAKENNWSDDTKAKQEMLLSQYMEALKKNDPVRAQEIYQQMEPALQHDIQEQQKYEMGVNKGMGSASNSTQANGLAQGTEASLDFRDDMVNAAALSMNDDTVSNPPTDNATITVEPINKSISAATEIDGYSVARNTATLTESFNPVATTVDVPARADQELAAASPEAQQPLTGLKKGFSLG